MKRLTLAALSLVLAFTAACTSTTTQPPTPALTDTLQPPTAERRQHVVTSPQGDRADPYYWLRDDTRQDPDVLAYLAAENSYTEAVLAPYEPLREALFEEIVGRLKSDDASPPSFHNGYWYYRRYESGKDYPILARRRGDMQALEEILLDQNQRAAGHSFYQLGAYSISPDNRLMAVSEDVVGRRQYVLRIRDLQSGRWLDDVVKGISPDLAWSDDNASVLYIENDPVTLLSKRVLRHRLGDSGADTELYAEPDDSYFITLYRGKSGQFLYILLESTGQNEVRYAAADDPDLNFRPVLPREPGHIYEVQDHAGRFIVLSNWQAKNFRLMSAPIASSAQKSTWRELVAGSADSFILGFDVFRDYLALNVYRDGQRKIEVRGWRGGEPVLIEGDQPAYAVSLIGSEEYDWPWLRYSVETLTNPDTTVEYHMGSGERRVLKVAPVEGDFDPARYASEFFYAPARDGARVPVSLVYRRDLYRAGANPLLVYGYGSYGDTEVPDFSVARLSLLDRGFVYAIAHIRGGQELGRDWYEQGRLGNKMNTFTDFIDVTRHLVQAGYGAPDKVFANGGSAGGLLMGAVANLAPELYRGIIADVPFVDVVTTMLDESIPLTTNEFGEWGNPKYQPDYATMLAYSPYDQVAEQDYPALLVTAGLWDSQVQYFEPAKWVARLRHRKTDDNWLLLRTNMDAGHGGQSGRYRRYEEIAAGYAFMLAQLGIDDPAALAVAP
ncbi:S9 family peptidase [Mangrovimicrobium sediminis]|uniref:S9 family peptidase n=1 Tax=Mangrovimicrobium sediminis TaxID=2562682 RepID=A0A4Z0M748_9GAMM|nr:S9 family peptidase [Haliea sp. SAOS-164]TGD75492.1 S9 family peptidase [Haliea sp. SAOS-164]